MAEKYIDNIKIGGRKMLSSDTFLIPKGEVCSFSINLTENETNYSFPVKIFFEDDGKSKQSVSFKPDASTNSMKMTLHNWDNSLGSALKEFYPIVNIENKTVIEMLMLNRRLGEVNELIIQFWRKDSGL